MEVRCQRWRVELSGGAHGCVTDDQADALGKALEMAKRYPGMEVVIFESYEDASTYKVLLRCRQPRLPALAGEVAA